MSRPTDTPPDRDQAAAWWRTGIIDMAPDRIRFRGCPVQQLIGRVSFVDMIWFLVVGVMPSPRQARLAEAALVAGVDHGPQAPSIAIARMAMTCGGSLNNALASAVNVLDDVHGGAGEQAMMLFQDIRSRLVDGDDLARATEAGLAHWRPAVRTIIPGFGHRFHRTDPRAPRLMALVAEVAETGEITGQVAAIAGEIERQLAAAKGRRIPMNIDGATAVIFSELGLPPPLGRGLFCLSRSVGILAHAWEQQQQGGRNKGPLPKGWLWQYDGEPPRDCPPV